MPYSHPVQPPLRFIPPHYRAWVVRGGYLILPLLLRLRLRPWLPAGIWPVSSPNPEVLAKEFHRFQTGQSRLIMAFRHSQVDDPLCLSYLFSRLVPQAAKQQGLSLKRPLHSYFMYDRGMPLWAGSWLTWFFASLGGIPVHRGRRLDLRALKSVREHVLMGQLPVTIAPEGATNGLGEAVSPLEPGTAQVAFWAVEDLQKEGRPEQVVLLPIGLRYLYPNPDWAALNRLMNQLEADCGLPVQSLGANQTRVADYYPRLLALGEHLLSRMEEFYQRFYPAPATPKSSPASPAPPATANLTGEALGQRLAEVLERSLQVGERFFKLPSTGSLATRCRRLEEAGWTYIHREDIQDIDQLAPFDRGLADWIATEATLQMRHMRLVESFVAITGRYIQDKPSFERLAETTLIMFDMVERVKGTRVPKRPQLGRRKAVVTLGQPIDVTQRWADYDQSRRAAKAAVETLTKDLQKSLEELIKSVD